MSYERMVKAEDDLTEVKSWLDKAGEVDATEDAEHGPDRRGDEMPDWMADKKQRLDRIRAARAALEADNPVGAKSRYRDALLGESEADRCGCYHSGTGLASMAA